MKNLLPFLFCMMPFLALDDGGTGGGAHGPVILAEWIRRLEEAAAKERVSIVEELAKALGIPVPDTWKKLKEAGWDPKKAKPSGAPPESEKDKDSPGDGGNSGGKTQSVSLRHNTPYPHYRRAGLVLTGQFKPCEVTREQLEILKKDPMVEIGK